MANKSIKITKRKKFISDGEFNQLLDIAYKENVRDWFMLYLIGNIGLRVGEAVRLKVEDVDISDKTISIPRIKIKTGKGGLKGKELSGDYVSLPLSGNALEVVDTYMKDYAPKEGWLFPISKRRAQAIFYRYAKKIGVRASIHSLRHYRGTKIYGATLDLQAVQSLLRLRNLPTAAIYTHPNMEILRKLTEKVDTEQ